MRIQSKFLPACLAFAASLAVATFPLGEMPLAGDGWNYWHEAGLWLEGMGERPWYFPPGMVLWLAAFRALGFSREVGGGLAVAILAAATAFAATALGERLLASRRGGLLAGVFAAVYPPAWLLAAQPVSQHLAQASLGATALAWLVALDGWRQPAADSPRERRRRRLRLGAWQALAGLVWGVAVLARPSAASLALAIGGSGFVCAWRMSTEAGERGSGVLVRSLRVGWRATLYCLPVAVVALLVVSPVLWHNHRVGAGACLSINNERNFWLGNNPHTPLYKTTHLAQRPLDELPEGTRRYLLRYYIRTEIAETRLRTGFSRRLRQVRLQEAWRHIRTRPGRFVLRSLNRLRAFWGFDYLGARQIQDWRGWTMRQAAPLYLLEAGGYCLVALLALVGILGKGRRAVKAASAAPETFSPSPRLPGVAPATGSSPAAWVKWVLVLFALAYQLPYSLAFSAGTYHFPAMVLLFPLAALGTGKIRQTGLRNLVRQWPVIAAWAMFAIIQLEYAYFALKWR